MHNIVNHIAIYFSFSACIIHKTKNCQDERYSKAHRIERRVDISWKRIKEGYEKNRVLFTVYSMYLFKGSRASATSTSFREFIRDSRRSRGLRQGSKSERSTKEAERRMVACLTSRLTRIVYCSTPEALGTSLARIAVRGFPVRERSDGEEAN